LPSCSLCLKLHLNCNYPSGAQKPGPRVGKCLLFPGLEILPIVNIEQERPIDHRNTVGYPISTLGRMPT
jgi:hypothetical protein